MPEHDQISTRQSAAKRTVQTLNESINSTPTKSVRSKIPKHNNMTKRMEDKKPEKKVDLEDIHEMMKNMSKLDKLDIVEERLKTFENDMKDMKASVEYAHAETQDLKTENETHKVSTEVYKQQVENLKKENQLLINSVIDLKARSMHDNLIFFNIKKQKNHV